MRECPRWLVAVIGVCAAMVMFSCTKRVDATSPQALQERYGISNAYRGQVATSDGAMHGTLVPVTLPDGRKAELIVPDGQDDFHTTYLHDANGLHPAAVQDSGTRDGLGTQPPR